MPIEIKKVNEDLYSAVVTPPDSDEVWRTREPMGAENLVNSILALGIHALDIHDFMYMADPLWIEKMRPVESPQSNPGND